jgi:hypothetical protein
MPVNRYFQNYPGQARFNNEHMLIEDVIVESIEIMGHAMYYIPRESFDEGDMIFGEYSKSKFNKAYLIDGYLANVTGFEGDGDFFGRFGLEIRDTSNFVISRRSFAKHVPSSMRHRPQEGDLVYVPVLHKMFELKFVEQELLFHQVGKRLPYVYELRCEAFRFAQDEIDTGVEDIDLVAEENAYKRKLNLNTSGTGNILEGDVIYQSEDGTWANATAHATVSDWFKANGTTFIYDISGIFTAGSNVYANSTNAIYRITSIDDEKSDFVKYDIYDNENFDTGADLILDLTEVNPFGTP